MTSWRSCFLWSCWWNHSHTFVAGMYTQDGDHGPVSRFVAVRDLADGTPGGFGRLRFGKAKLFGVYTGMNELNFDPQHAVSGSRYTFTWVAD